MTMDDNDNDRTLDGNAVAGMLAEMFALGATSAMVRCDTCDHEDPLGTATVYANAPGVVVRCRGCSSVLMRFAEIRDRVMVDMRGSARVELRGSG
jgi:hypothetical protein